MAKNIAKLALVVSLIFGMNLPVLACVGARPLAMGGAFIAVSDDANAVYWNPAGLTRMPQESMYTYMETVAGRINYQWFFSGVERYGKVVFGISGINSHNPRVLVDFGGKEYGSLADDTWYQLSLAIPVSELLSFGANLKFYDSKLYVPGVGILPGRGTGLDLAVLLQVSDNVRVGLLSQDLFGTDLNYTGGLRLPYKNNVRPGVAWDVTEDTTIAVDIYDLTGAADLSAGVEKRFANGALRGGYYHDTWTVGFGLQAGKAYSFDYCYIYDSHIISLSWTF